jgi:hypothetical protein
VLHVPTISFSSVRSRYCYISKGFGFAKRPMKRILKFCYPKGPRRPYHVTDNSHSQEARMEEWRYSSTILDLDTRGGGVTGQLDATAASSPPPGKSPPVHNGSGARWASEPVWTLWSRENPLASAGNRAPAIQSLAHRYTDWVMTYSPLKVNGRFGKAGRLDLQGPRISPAENHSESSILVSCSA